MKVGVETGYSVDLTERHMNLGGELLQAVSGKISELMLNGPEFIDQAPGSSWLRRMARMARF